VGKTPHEDGTIRFHNRVCVLAVEALKKKILNGGSQYATLGTPYGNKLYKDLKQTFW